MTKQSFAGSAMLMLTAIIWGLAFVAQRYGAELIDAVSLNEIRYFIATIVLGLVVVCFDLYKKKKGQKIIPFNRDTLIGGALCGSILMIATLAQQYGLESTTAGKAGFITALYIVFVPIFGVLARRRTPVVSRIAIVIAIVGFWTMCVTDGLQISKGDLLIFLCSLVFTFQIIFIDIYVRNCDPIKFSFIQFVSAMVCGFPFLVANGFPTLQAVESAILPLLYMGILSSGVAYTLQVAGQKRVNPAIATLIMSLESVFALIGGAIVLKESNSPRELIGCLLVFVAVFIAQIETAPKFLKFKQLRFFNE